MAGKFKGAWLSWAVFVAGAIFGRIETADTSKHLLLRNVTPAVL